MSLYDDLGVKQDASGEEIKKAYKRMASKTHPDKPGGDGDKFHAIQLAYEVLSNDGRRKHYDDTGETEYGVAEALTAIAQMLLTILDAEEVDIEHTDLVKTMQVMVRRQQAKSREEILRLQGKIDKSRKVLARARQKAGALGMNVLHDILNKNIRACEMGVAGLKADIEFGSLMLKILNDYEYKMDLIVPNKQFFSEFTKLMMNQQGPT